MWISDYQQNGDQFNIAPSFSEKTPRDIYIPMPIDPEVTQFFQFYIDICLPIMRETIELPQMKQMFFTVYGQTFNSIYILNKVFLYIYL